MPRLDPTTGLKQCTRCKEYKGAEQFALRKRASDGLTSACKTCDKKSDAKYRRENPEKIKEKDAKFRRENPEKVKAYTAARRNILAPGIMRSEVCRRLGLASVKELDFAPAEVIEAIEDYTNSIRAEILLKRKIKSMITTN